MKTAGKSENFPGLYALFRTYSTFLDTLFYNILDLFRWTMKIGHFSQYIHYSIKNNAAKSIYTYYEKRANFHGTFKKVGNTVGSQIG